MCSILMMESMRKLLIVLLVGVTCVELTVTLDCSYRDKSCSCGPYITCYDLQQIPPLNTGVNVTNVIRLSFQYGNITIISNNSLTPGLAEIEFSAHPITDISEDAFDTSAATLQRVYISGAKFNSLPTALKKLTKLTVLSITNTPIQVWDTPTLAQVAATLESLVLRNVTLSAWPSWISEFHLLRTLDLSLNPLNFIPDNAFNFAKVSLTSLDLSDTGLTHVPRAVSTLLNLASLQLSNNQFAEVSEFENLTGSPLAKSLSFLGLNSAGLTRATNFPNLTSLSSFVLSNNRISDVPAGSLPTSLTSLYLSNNTLSSVPKDIAGISKLSFLDLSKNIITGIEPNTLPSSLTYLNADFNNLTTITNTTFSNLNLLDSLGLSFNPISVISSYAFSDLVSLKYLNLINSQLTEIPLAFSLLNPDIDLYFTTTAPLSCPCPAPTELVKWFTSFRIPAFFPISCSNREFVSDYLSGQCGQPSDIP